MIFRNIKYPLTKLIKEGQKWQYTDIKGNTKKPKYLFSGLQFILLFIAVTVAIISKKELNKDFVGYVLAALSIFVGLFLTLLLTIFDKFGKIKFSEPNLSEVRKVHLIMTKNFFRQFSALTAYSIFIAIVCIVLLSLTLVSDFSTAYIFDYQFVVISEVELKHILNFFYLSLIIVYRIVTLYLLLDFILLILYALSNLFAFINQEYDKVKIKK